MRFATRSPGSHAELAQRVGELARGRVHLGGGERHAAHVEVLAVGVVGEPPIEQRGDRVLLAADPGWFGHAGESTSRAPRAARRAVHRAVRAPGRELRLRCRPVHDLAFVLHPRRRRVRRVLGSARPAARPAHARGRPARLAAGKPADPMTFTVDEGVAFGARRHRRGRARPCRFSSRIRPVACSCPVSPPRSARVPCTSCCRRRRCRPRAGSGSTA